MDLGTIQDALKDFATFGKNIGDAFQLIPTVLGDTLDFFVNFKELSSTTEEAADASKDAGSAILSSTTGDAGDTTPETTE
ncbi:hypothetical protein SAMN06295981_1203 [Corynebacterium pollutisoli]|uniref:Uncharacterized protein n=1 Tax=Corynebacterium pollutisoli TaxID=1610489 RepID=A0A1X7J4N2_9CORY|nr:PorH family porin [Corynebacterium pollutisoli]SMG21824.1 hypothetical protein SAMN06295981_1203 [Corynebacterium pollutisoli]